MLIDSLLDDLVRISHTILSSYHVEKIMSRVVSSMKYHLGCSQCGLLLVNESTGSLEVKISRGISETSQRDFRAKHYRMADEPFQQVAGSGKLLRLQSGDEWSPLRFERDEEVLLTGCIKNSEGCSGIAFAQTGNPEGFTHDNEAYFALLINIVSLTLEMTTLRGRLKEVEMFDRLTGLLNYNGFQIMAERTFHLNRKCGETTGILVLDLDNFKPYRATYGIAGSEKVLKETADLIRQCVGEGSIVGRYGLDEFIVWIEHRDKKKIQELAEQIKDSICTHKYPRETPRITVTIGAALCLPEQDVDFIELVGCAKENLYGAKRGNKTIRINEVSA